MPSSYLNDLRIELQATGENANLWGEKLNDALTQIGDALAYGTQDCFATDADATTTVADGAADPARAMYFKVTSSATLTATRVLTIAPNTISRVMFIENATTGSQSITISQGSGANVTIATGKTKVVYLDGAGATAAVVDAMANVDPGVTDTLAEVLVAGNTSGGTGLTMSSGDDLTLTGAAYNVVWDSSDNALEFADNAKAIFGAGSDLQIYHDGSNSRIHDAGTGVLLLQTDGTGVQIKSDGSESIADFNKNGGVNLYFDNSKKLATTSTGIDVTGTVTADGLISELSTDTQGRFSGWSVVGANADSGAIELGQTSAYQGVISYSATGSTRFIFDNTYGSAASTFEFRTNTSTTPKTHLKIDGSGDISFYEDTGTTPKLVWSAASEKLTLSGTGGLDVTGNTILGDASTDTVRVNGYMGVGGAVSSDAGLRVTSSALTGSGPSAVTVIPTHPSSATSAGYGVYSRVATAAAAFTMSNAYQFYAANSSLGAGSTITNQHGVYIADQTQGTNNYGFTSLVSSGTNKFNIYASGTAANYFAGQVGIGTDSPTFASGYSGLHINKNYPEIHLTNTNSGATASDGFKIQQNSSSNVFLWNYENAFLAIGTNNTERMRIDSSGNLLVGKTASGITNEGVEFRPGGQIFGTQDGSYPLLLNRVTSDGDIAQFRKDNVTVGSIGVINSNNLTISGAVSNHTGIEFGTTVIAPMKSGVANDGGVDLGFTNARFKDLYLSGGLRGDTTFSNNAGTTEYARFDSSGNFLVGTSSTFTTGDDNTGSGSVFIAQQNDTVLTLKRAGGNGTIASFIRGGVTSPVGSISIDASSTTYNTSSDQRLKDNIVDAPSASDDIDAIQVRSFDWKVDGSHQKYGMVAQELVTVAPEAVSQPEDPEEMMGVDYSKLVPMLIKEVQQLRARVAQLEGAN